MELFEQRYYVDRITPFCNLLNEALVRSYNIENVERDLLSRFENVIGVKNHAVWLYRMPLHRDQEMELGHFEIKLSSFDNLNKIIETIEKSYGWFPAAIVLNGNITFIDWDKNGKFEKATPPYTGMLIKEYVKRFLHTSLKSISLFVEAKFTVEDFDIKELYHITDKKYLAKIKKNGLVPKSHGNFPERVYFGKDIDTINRMIGGKFGEQTDVLLRLNFEDFNKDIRNKYVFYKDPRESSAVFTYDCINPKYIQMYDVTDDSWKNI